MPSGAGPNGRSKQDGSDPHSASAAEYLGPLIERYGRLQLEPTADVFTRLVASALRQQVSIAAAEATRERPFDAVEIKGVGERTARMQLLFSLARPDVFPVGDLGVRRGMGRFSVRR